MRKRNYVMSFNERIKALKKAIEYYKKNNFSVVFISDYKKQLAEVQEAYDKDRVEIKEGNIT